MKSHFLRVLALGMVNAVFFFGSAQADHCPEDKIANGRPEHTLAGVDVTQSKLPEAVRALGPPTKHEEGHGEGDPAGSGWGEYEWKHARTTVKISTDFYTSRSGARVESVKVVEVSGNPSGLKGTGKGLQLADTEGRMKALYGATFVSGTVNGPELGHRTITYCFEDETELSIGLDKAGHIVAIQLAASVE